MAQADQFWEVDAQLDSTVWLRRTSAPYHTLHDAQAGFDWVLWKFATLPRNKHGLVIDVRRAPKANNDPCFEAVVKLYWPRLPTRFVASVALVGTAAGVMQLTRLSRESGHFIPVTDDPERARRILLEALSAKRP